jgi:hypothetical protein
MKDSYEVFFKKFVKKEDFFKFGLEEIIYIDSKKAEIKWNELKKSIKNNQKVFIRGYGRNSSGSELVLNFYKKVFQNKNIVIDKTNNLEPTKVLNECTEYRKNIKKDSDTFKKIQNYQVSHIFGKTKNPFLFTAPWNIVYIPKMLDPFTGHESKGENTSEFRKLFHKKSYTKFKNLIEDYNSVLDSHNIESELNDYICILSRKKDIVPKKLEQFRKDMALEFEKIKA